MTAAALLDQIRSAGGSCRLVGDQLRISAPPGTVDRSVLTAHRLALLRLLAHERVREVLDRFALARPRSYSSTPDADQWDRIEEQVDAALRIGSGLNAAINAYERDGLALITHGRTYA
jgi:hypothetical protein